MREGSPGRGFGGNAASHHAQTPNSVLLSVYELYVTLVDTMQPYGGYSAIETAD